MSYSVDTSALMDMWCRHHPPDVFPTLWEKIDGLIDAGRLLAIDEVLHELQKKDDALHKWVVQRSQMVVQLDEAIQKRARMIINEFKSLTDTRAVMSGAADPFVIALALERNLTVLQTEKSKPKKPRIPDVCKTLHVPCIKPVELFRRESWRV